MSAASASARYMLLDRMAEEKLKSQKRKAARRVNWRAYAVWAKGFRKKFFSNLQKARAYWTEIKRLGSAPIIESRKFGVFVRSRPIEIIAPVVVRSTRAIAVRKAPAPIPHWSIPAWMHPKNFPVAPAALMAGAIVMMILASLPSN